jgi:hypothetical protein
MQDRIYISFDVNVPKIEFNGIQVGIHIDNEPVLSFNKIRLNGAQGWSLNCNLIAGNFELLILAPNFKYRHIF